MHARPVPVALDRLAIQFHVHFVLLAKTHHQIASGPGVVRGLGRTLGENLEFPLALGDFRVDAFVIDTRGQAEIQMLFDDLYAPGCPCTCSRRRSNTGPAGPG